MKYPRPPYSKDAEFVKGTIPFTSDTLDVPKLDFPVSIRENFRRVAERNDPCWIPNSLVDIQEVSIFDLAARPLKDPIPAENGRMYWYDAFDCIWVFVPEAGGPMLKPGEPPMLSDITRWEKDLKWPDTKQYDYKGSQEKFLKDNPVHEKVWHVNIGQSCTERLVALLGGYEQAMTAMAEEPEACRDFFDAFAEFTANDFLHLTEWAKMDFVTFHDDWGTERDTFFSCRMMEDLVFEPTKKIIDAIKSTGAKFQLHSCGRIERFVPYMIDMGCDFVQLQRRANDVPMLKEKYGDKIGFNLDLEGVTMGVDIASSEEGVRCVQDSIRLYGKNGGYYTKVVSKDPKVLWDVTQELYLASREYYGK